MYGLWWAISLWLLLPPGLQAQAVDPAQGLEGNDRAASTAEIHVDWARLPDAVRLPLKSLNVKQADLRDVFRALAVQYDLNLSVDDRIRRQVTVRLANLPVIEALVFLCEEHGLGLHQQGQVFRITQPPAPPPPPVEPPPPLAITATEGLLSVDLQAAPLEQTIREVATQSGVNIMVRRGVSGTLTGLLQSVPWESGLQALLRNNGFALREQDRIYLVDRLGASMEGAPAGRSLFVHVRDGYIDLDVAQAPIGDVLRELGHQLDVSIIQYEVPQQQTLTANVTGLTLDQTLTYLFKGTGITYRRDGEIYLIGSAQNSSITTSRLIRLQHARVEGLLDLIPEAIRQGAMIEIVRELNGLMVIGTQDAVDNVALFVREIDHPSPQILIEALVVDYETTDLKELGVTLGTAASDSSLLGNFNLFGGGADQQGGLVIQGDGQRASGILDTWGDLLGVGIGRLPSDFFFRIQALEQEGKAKVLSRPQIATLNGHTASISIGTTQYFILTSTTPLQSPNQIVTQESERFETIEANVSLEITPWVTSTGEVTVDVHPEFSTPVGSFTSGVPPTINSRVLDSTVRLRDGETIILGGLIQETEAVSYNKVPLLGDIPLLGQLFRNRSHNNRKSELVIYITPHVFYGDETDGAKWQTLHDRMDLREAQGINFQGIEIVPTEEDSASGQASESEEGR